MFIFLLSTIAVFVVGTVGSAGKNARKEYKSITVRQGDTLWNIAAQYRGETEIREYIYQIKKLNNLDNATIYPGQKLDLP